MATTQIRKGQVELLNIVNTDISTNAAIDTNKLAEGTKFLKSDGTNLMSSDFNLNSYKIINLAQPVNPNDAARLADIQLAQAGLSGKEAARVLSENNTTLSGLQTIDDIVLLANDRVLLINQTDKKQNGLWLAQSSTWTRPSDFTGSTTVKSGAHVFIAEGTKYNDSGWIVSTDGPITVGTTEIIFAQFNGASKIVAGLGLTKSGNILNLGSSSTLNIAEDTVDLNTIGTAGTYTKVTTDAYGRVISGIVKGTTGASLLADYGITDAALATHTHAFSAITSKPTTLAGYGITDAAASSHTHTKSQITDFPASLPASDVSTWAKAATKPTYAFNEITSKPTTISGYGITDAITTGNIGSQSVSYASSSSTTSQRNFAEGLVLGCGQSTGRGSTYGIDTVNLILAASNSTGTAKAGIDFRSGYNYPSDGAQIYYESDINGSSSGEISRLVIRNENDANDTILIRAGQIVLNGKTVDGGGTNPPIVFQMNDSTLAYIDSEGKYSGKVDWGNVNGKPTTISGYGITDAASSSHTHTLLYSLGNSAPVSDTALPTNYGLEIGGVYSNGYPISYGNVLRGKTLGGFELVLGWSGTDGAHADNYIRSKRDNNSGAWSGWAKIWTNANLTNLNQLTNGPGYITGINSTMVTNALGFTPYNSTNPNGYISSINSTMVTNALGFTPVARVSNNRPGVTKLYRNDSDDAYNIQINWTGSYWHIKGYYNDSYHAGCMVDYASSASNADTVDSLHVASGRNNSANQIVRTDGNGYIQCGYINSNSGNEGNNYSPVRVWGTNGSDDYMRTYLTSALSVGYATNAGNTDTLDGNHATRFLWSESANGYYGMMTPTGSNSDWIRTTIQGIIPYNSGGASSIGTSSWPFTTMYATSYYVSSARDLKENIKEIKEDVLPLINNIDIVSFNYKTDEEKNKKIGFIADDTDEIFATKQHDTMDLYNTCGMLIKAVQELSSKIDNLEEENNKLKDIIYGMGRS